MTSVDIDEKVEEFIKFFEFLFILMEYERERERKNEIKHDSIAIC